MRSAFALAVAAALCSCALARTGYWHSYADEKKDGVALVFGYVDMKQAPSPLQRLRARRLDGEAKGEDVYFGTRGGLFFHEDLPPGRYKLESLEGVPALFYLGSLAVWPGQPYALALPPKVGVFEVKGPGVFYAGSYEYRRTPGFIDAFTVLRSTSPGERQLLPALSRVLVESRWEKPVAEMITAAAH